MREVSRVLQVKVGKRQEDANWYAFQAANQKRPIICGGCDSKPTLASLTYDTLWRPTRHCQGV